ncbi:MAG: hypothetical protein APF77_06610 [Clostridia bacterium BRH_c25]|nr:MAG: hypothetical protein APF77_06610 [Clostridia bacterium BRH_c25]
MYNETIKQLMEHSCPSIKYRIKKEILEDDSGLDQLQHEILQDNRVQYALSWQNDDGYFGEVFHGGWIPREKRKYSTTGAESALRFLREMGFSVKNDFVKRGLDALLKEGWNKGGSKWNSYIPEIGLHGQDYIRSVVFAYFGIEDHGFIKTEIERAMEVFIRSENIHDFDDITGVYKNKRFYKSAVVLPEIYHLRLLAYTNGWRNEESLGRIKECIEHLINLSPIPDIYIKYKSQLIAPAMLYPRNLSKKLSDFTDRDWFCWFHTFELFARLGVVKDIPQLLRQLDEFKTILRQGEGFFRIKPDDYGFKKWSAYTGLALEKDWKNERWMYDLTFRSLLILKYAGEL